MHVKHNAHHTNQPTKLHHMEHQQHYSKMTHSEDMQRHESDIRTARRDRLTALAEANHIARFSSVNFGILCFNFLFAFMNFLSGYWCCVPTEIISIEQYTEGGMRNSAIGKGRLANEGEFLHPRIRTLLAQCSNRRSCSIAG